MPITELSHPAAKKSLIIRLEIFFVRNDRKRDNREDGLGIIIRPCGRIAELASMQISNKYVVALLISLLTFLAEF